jgi:hypothetical protein
MSSMWLFLAHCNGSICVMSVFDAHDLATILDVVDAAESCVHFLQHDTLGFWNAEPNEDCEEDVDACEQVEGVEAAFLWLQSC